MKLIKYQKALKLLNADALTQLYQGQIFLWHSTTSSRLLAEHARTILQTSLQTDYPDSLHEIWTPKRLHHSFTRVRQIITQDSDLRGHYQQVLAELGIDPAQWQIDFPRLRAVIPGAENIPAAAPMFYAHRDTWYANPANQINLWIPLADYPAAQTFIFWPELIDSQIDNDSADFNYSQWQSNTGFQNPTPPPNSAYPKALKIKNLTPHGFDCQAGDMLVFAAAQLHQTLANPGPQIRFSLDLRAVPIKVDSGALDPDNASSGSTLDDYSYLQVSYT